MTFGRHALAAASLLTLLAATGCSDDPEPKFSPTPSASPTTSATPDPEAWEVKSEKGAYAFVRHWIETLNQSGQDGNTTPLMAVSSQTCTSCKNLVDYIDEVYGNGGSIEGSGWKILSLGELPPG